MTIPLSEAIAQAHDEIFGPNPHNELMNYARHLGEIFRFMAGYRGSVSLAEFYSAVLRALLESV